MWYVDGWWYLGGKVFCLWKIIGEDEEMNWVVGEIKFRVKRLDYVRWGNGCMICMYGFF